MELVTLFSSPGRKTAKEMHDDDDETAAAVQQRGRKEGRKVEEENNGGGEEVKVRQRNYRSLIYLMLAFPWSHTRIAIPVPNSLANCYRTQCSYYCM